MSVEALGEKLQVIVQVENVRPMLKYEGSPFFNRGKKLFGSVHRRKFKVWENARQWNGGLMVTYVNGAYTESGTGTCVLLRARPNRIQQLLFGGCIGCYLYFSGRLLYLGTESARGTIVLLSVGLLALLAATGPFVAVHRFMAKKIISYLVEELGLEEVKTPVPARKSEAGPRE